jgi:hypothetical protein
MTTNDRHAIIPTPSSSLAEITSRPNPRITRGIAMSYALSLTEHNLGDVVAIIREYRFDRSDPSFANILHSTRLWLTLEDICLQPHNMYLLCGNVVYSCNTGVMTDAKSNPNLREWCNPDYDGELDFAAIASNDTSWLAARYDGTNEKPIMGIYTADWIFAAAPRRMFRISGSVPCGLASWRGNILGVLDETILFLLDQEGNLRLARSDSVLSGCFIVGDTLFSLPQSPVRQIKRIDLDNVAWSETSWAVSSESTLGADDVHDWVRCVPMAGVEDIRLEGFPVRCAVQGDLLVILESDSPVFDGLPNQSDKEIEAHLTTAEFRISAYSDGSCIGGFEPRWDGTKLIPTSLAASSRLLAVHGIQLSTAGVREGLIILQGGTRDDWHRSTNRP